MSLPAFTSDLDLWSLTLKTF